MKPFHFGLRATIRHLIGAMLLALAGSLLSVGGAHAAAPAWRIAAVNGPTNLPPLSDEIQEVTVDATGGSFTISFGSQTTQPLKADVPPAVLRAALEALPAIGSDGVQVSGGPGGAGGEHPYFVRFAGRLARTDLAPLAADSALLTGGAAQATVTTELDGGLPGKGAIAIYATNIGGGSAGGPLAPTEVLDTLPAGLSVTSASGSGWTCATASSQVNCSSTRQVNPGQSLGSILVSVRVESGEGQLGSNQVTISGGGTSQAATFEAPVFVASSPASPGIQVFEAGAYDEDGKLSTRAGAHPFQASTAFFLNTLVAPSGKIVAAGDPRNIEVALPSGFLGNPLAALRCPREAAPVCDEATQVGTAYPLIQGFGAGTDNGSSIFNDTPAHGYPAEFTFNALSETPVIQGEVRSDGDYGITVVSPNTAQVYNVYGAIVTLCSYGSGGGIASSTGCRQRSESKANNQPLLTNPANCAEEAATPPLTTLNVNTWQQPTAVARSTVVLPAIRDCAALAGHFDPTFAFAPRGARAATPAAFTADLSVPQEGLTEADGLAAPPLKDAVVKLPAGVVANPSSAGGLETCTEAQIGLLTTTGAAPSPIRFDRAAPSCPEASKLGSIVAESPLLDQPLSGTIYLATQEANPFGSLLALYLVLEDPRHGILIKLPGKVTPDPQSGQLSASFADNPQLPVSSLHLRFRGGGSRAPLATPDVCGTYTTVGEWTPWSAPESGPPAQTQSSFEVTDGASGGPCPRSPGGRTFAPGFEAGTTLAMAGNPSPLVVKVSRNDGEQELTRVQFTLPPGLTGKLADIPYCSDAAIAAARGRSGRAEQAAPSCPAASRLGSVSSSAGFGSEPIRVGGSVYLAGPYKGAPISVVVITPAVAGPFDLGNVVVRAALDVDPTTTQITAKSDPIPTILRGIPLQLRSVAIDVDRPGFTVNPTSCDPMPIAASLSGGSDALADVGSRFQLGGCGALKFKPKLKLSLRGGTRRSKFPALRAVLTQPGGQQANTRYVRVLLPHSAFLEQAHIRTVCTRVQFAAGAGGGSACPRGAIYGRAKAWTPLLAAPLEGNVYLRSNGGERALPDLVAALRGPASQPIQVDLLGYVDAKRARLRNTFALVPDAPVSRFVLEMYGGKKGLIVNSENLCKAKKQLRRASVQMIAHNNMRADQFPIVANQCRAKKGKKKRATAHHRVSSMRLSAP